MTSDAGACSARRPTRSLNWRTGWSRPASPWNPPRWPGWPCPARRTPDRRRRGDSGAGPRGHRRRVCEKPIRSRPGAAEDRRPMVPKTLRSAGPACGLCAQAQRHAPRGVQRTGARSARSRRTSAPARRGAMRPRHDGERREPHETVAPPPRRGPGSTTPARPRDMLDVPVSFGTDDHVDRGSRQEAADDAARERICATQAHAQQGGTGAGHQRRPPPARCPRAFAPAVSTAPPATAASEELGPVQRATYKNSA